MRPFWRMTSSTTCRSAQSNLYPAVPGSHTALTRPFLWLATPSILFWMSCDFWHLSTSSSHKVTPSLCFVNKLTTWNFPKLNVTRDEPTCHACQMSCQTMLTTQNKCWQKKTTILIHSNWPVYFVLDAISRGAKDCGMARVWTGACDVLKGGTKVKLQLTSCKWRHCSALDNGHSVSTGRLVLNLISWFEPLRSTTL